jgi:glycosyltransferase involved in cell wall biosynthesis
MKILMTTTSFPLYKDHTAGIFIYEQAKSFLSLGQEVTILAPFASGSKKNEIIDDIKIKRFDYFFPQKHQGLCYGAGVPANLKKGLKYKIQLPLLVFFFFVHCLLLGRKHDVIYAHWTLSGLSAVIVGKILRKPVVVMIHHGQENFNKLKFLHKIPIEKADHVVFNSSFTMGKTLISFKPKAYSVIPPGVDINKFKPIDVSGYSKYFQSYGINKDSKVIFAMGRHIDWKGYDYLLKAFADIEDKYVLLVLAGSGPETANLKNLAKNLKIEKRVIFAGSIQNDKTPLFYNRSLLFVQPSIIDEHGNTEGLGVVILEALACGTPVAASSVGGIIDIIINGENGFLFEQKNSQQIKNIIEKSIKREFKDNNLPAKARDFVLNKYSWDILTEKNLNLLLKL